MQIITTDLVIIGAGGGGLRAAIAAAEQNPDLEIALVSKVYPMRSHTVAAEGGSAAVAQEHDHADLHFNDTVSGGDWLCDQDVVEYFVDHSPGQMVQMEHWGCPWSRKPDGSVNVRAFGGMKIERTWFAADKTGFHMLHTLFQTSMKYPSIHRYDEHFCIDLVVAGDQVQGVVVQDLAEGVLRFIQAKAVIIATGGAVRVFTCNTNGGIVTGDGMALAYRHGVPLRDMEFVQYHPTGLPGSGILMTEGCRGEGGILVNKEGYRYLQDYGLGPETPVGQPKNKFMELGPRDRVSQSFWHELQQGRCIDGPWGEFVHLDLRHLGEEKINDRLPFIRELAKAYANVDPVNEPIPVRPAAHYTMGGIETNIRCETRLAGLFAIGECASTGLHGANRLGSNSLAELIVMGKVVGENAASFAREQTNTNGESLVALAEASCSKAFALFSPNGTESAATIQQEMGRIMEKGVGIYRTGEGMQEAIDTLATLKQRYQNIRVADQGKVFNTDWLYAIELGFLLDVAESMAHSALARKESRGAHQRLDEFNERDDVNFLKHSLANYQPDEPPDLSCSDVVITKSPPAKRVYGSAMEQQEASAASHQQAEQQAERK